MARVQVYRNGKLVNPVDLTEITSRLKVTQTSKFQGQKGRGLGHVTYFYNLHFGTPFICLEWVKLETSNLVRGLTPKDTNQKCKSRSEGKSVQLCAFQNILLQKGFYAYPTYF